MSNFIFTNQFYNDDKGRTLPKARLYFYDNNTFNFADVYSDPELTQVLDNPVTADGAGRLPQIFMDISKTYRVWLKDRNDVQVTPYIDDYTPQASISDLGTAAFLDTGTAPNELPQNSDLGTAAYLDAGINSGDVTIQTKGTWTPTLANSYGTTITEGAGATSTGTWKIIGDEAFIDFYINFDDSGSSPIAGDRIRIEGMPAGVAPSAENGWFSAGSANLYGSVASGNNAFFDCAVSENFNDDAITLSCLQSFGTTNYSMALGGRVVYKIR